MTVMKVVFCVRTEPVFLCLVTPLVSFFSKLLLSKMSIVDKSCFQPVLFIDIISHFFVAICFKVFQ